MVFENPVCVKEMTNIRYDDTLYIIGGEGDRAAEDPGGGAGETGEEDGGDLFKHIYYQIYFEESGGDLLKYIYYQIYFEHTSGDG